MDIKHPAQFVTQCQFPSHFNELKIHELKLIVKFAGFFFCPYEI